MAISEDTKAIISQLQEQGELVRNSGANSLREVNVRLDKFNDAFVSIAANIAGNNQMLSNSQKALREQAEYDRQQRDFDDLKRDKEVKVKEKSDLGIAEGFKDMKKSLSGFSMSGISSSIGKAIGVGMGAFIGGNLLKGFIDERYDGAFTALQTSFSELDLSSLSKSLKDIELSTQALVEQMEKINETVKNVTDSIIFKLVTTAGVITAISGTFKHIIGPYVKDALAARRERRRNQMNLFRDADAQSMDNLEEFNRRNNRGPLVDSNGPLGMGDPDINGDSGFKPFGTTGGSNVDTSLPPRLTAPNGPTVFTIPNNVTDPGQRNNGRVMGSFGASGQGNFLTRAAGNQSIIDSSRGPNGEFGVGRSPGAQAGFKKPKGAFMSKAELDLAFKELGQLRLFKEVVKGLVFVGVAWTIYDSIRLYQAWQATPKGPEGDEMRKQILVDEFGSLITGAGGAALGAFIGTFGGPWGILIFSVIGGIAGSLAGPYIAGLVYDWANGEPLNEQQAQDAIAAIDGRIDNLRTNNAFAAKATGTGYDAYAGYSMVGGDLGIKSLLEERNSLSVRVASLKRRRAVTASSGSNQQAYENAAFGTGGRRMYEISQHGSPQQKAVLLDALLEVETRYQQGMTSLEEYLTRTQNGTTIINAPTNVNPNITNTHGGNSKADVTVLGGSGTGDPLITGLPFATN